MESKLKLLKIVELKDVLTRAEVPIPTRANKPDLIAKIIESTAALNVYDELYGGGTVRASGASTPKPVVATASGQGDTVGDKDSSRDSKPDILAPPEPFDWTAGTEASADLSTSKSVTKPSATKASAKPPSKKDPAPAPVAAKPSASTTTDQQPAEGAKAPEPSAEDDEELKKRRARAERFGIPLVTPQQSQTKKVSGPAAPKGAATTKVSNGPAAKSKSPKVTNPVGGDSEALKTRAMRFGLPEKTKHVKPSSEAAARVTGQAKASPEEATRVKGQKRAAPTEAVDAEEAERRRKRAERFGMPLKT